MLPVRPISIRSGLTLALAPALVACAPYAPLPGADTPSLEQRLLDLERRVARMEARHGVGAPYRNKAEIQAHIRELQEERGKLLIGYTAQHPAIRDIDRRLEILAGQLEMLEQP